MANIDFTIRKMVGSINQPTADGGFWLPNIQRPFVWSEEQICRLFDSIMRRYPISTMLVWVTKEQVYNRKFVDLWKDGTEVSDFKRPLDHFKKNMVLDGQQRLQSLYIGLKGSYNGKELYLDILSGEVSAPDDVKYKFEFKCPDEAEFPWIRFKDLTNTDLNIRQYIDRIEALSGRQLLRSEEAKVSDHIELLNAAFKTAEVLSYQALDSIDYPDLYTVEDIVEVFIRANSGGTKLSKSDLLFSLLTASWNKADENMSELLQKLNSSGFGFDRDFILKTSLTILDKGARYEVSKFRSIEVRDEVEEHWDRISQSISAVLDYVKNRTYIQCDKALPSYLVLIPLIYLHYHFPDRFVGKGMADYIVRSSLSGAFSGHPDNAINAITNKIKETGSFDIAEIFGVMRNQNRALEISEDRLWQMGYGSDYIHLLFNLWYRDFNHRPAYENNMPQVDHIFPQALLRKVKAINPSTGRNDMTKYKGPQRNQLANCMLLTREENGPGGKGDTPPEVWFADKDEDYLRMHLIPADKSLWTIDRFDDFIAARKRLIVEKFAELLASTNVSASFPAPEVV